MDRRTTQPLLGAARLLALMACTCTAGCDSDDTPPNQGGWYSMDSSTVTVPGPEAGTGAPGSDASAVPGSDGGVQMPDAALPGLDSGAQTPDGGQAMADGGATLEAGAQDSGQGLTDGAPPDTGAQTPDGAAAMPGTVPIPAPVADDCITNVSAGDHTFTCEDVEFQVMVDERCTKFACGLIFDVHGAAMAGQDMRDNTRLHELAPSKGYLVVHPSAPNATWDWQTHPQILQDFMTRMIKAFHVDTRRVHMTGFSMGAGMTFWFLCNHTAALASTAPVTGSSASQVTVVGSGAPCIESIDANWRPRVPILFMTGTLDSALSIDAARERTNGIVTRLGLTGGQQIDGDDTFTRKRWTGAEGMVFDFLEHNYTNFLLAGHCIPSDAGGLFGCDSGGNTLKWGPVVLQWFIDHPKP